MLRDLREGPTRPASQVKSPWLNLQVTFRRALEWYDFLGKKRTVAQEEIDEALRVRRLALAALCRSQG